MGLKHRRYYKIEEDLQNLQLLTLFVFIFPGYIVEARAEDEEDFTVMLSTNGYETKAILRELKTDTRYRFQIKAVNKAGAGEESEATDFVLIQDDRGNVVWLSVVVTI